MEKEKIKVTNIHIRKEIVKKAKIKMINEFDIDNFSALIRVLIKKYLSYEIKITKSEYKKYVKITDQTTRNKTRLNIYFIREDVDEFEERIYDLLSKNRQRNKMLEILIYKWINNKVKIKSKEYKEESNIEH